MPETNYEELTVPELKDLADKRGIEILSDARKAEIIAALEASEMLLHPPPESKGDSGELVPDNTLPGEEENPRPEEPTKPYQMSSTVDADIPPEDFARLKLHS